jgi:prevent-host-death family protein
MRYMNISQARTNLLELVKQLDERIIITKSGRPVAVMLDVDDYRSLHTAQVLARDPERLVQLKKAVETIKASKATPDEGNLEDAVPEAIEVDPSRLVHKRQFTTPSAKKIVVGKTRVAAGWGLDKKVHERYLATRKFGQRAAAKRALARNRSKA